MFIKWIGVAVVVQILHLLLFEVGGVEFLAGPVRAVELRAGDHVFEPAAVEGLALSGLGKFEVDDKVWISIYFELDALSQFTGSKNGCHLLVLSAYYFI